MTPRARRALRITAVATCATLAAGALAGRDLRSTARSQVFDYPPSSVPRGTPGVTNRVQAASVPGYRGPVLVCQKPGVNCRPLNGEALVGIGAYLDTSRGAAKLETPRADGTDAGTIVYAGLFRLKQARQQNAILVAELQGQLPTGCPATRRARIRATPRGTKRKSGLPRRRLWSDGSGRFRATGRYGSATVRGTKWLIEERCSGTFVDVRRGSVEVDDRTRHRTVIVSAPRSYLIRPPR